ncbi:hypothetical protein [Yersinia phage MHG19]|nr:hypothetical protein [Yersinia phage MHG19]
MNYIQMLDSSIYKTAKLRGVDKPTACKNGLLAPLSEGHWPTYVAMSFYYAIKNTHKHYACPEPEMRKVFIKKYEEFKAGSPNREGYAEIQFDLCLSVNDYIMNTLFA